MSRNSLPGPQDEGRRALHGGEAMKTILRTFTPFCVVGLIGGVFLMVGVVVLPDYGISFDQDAQRNLAKLTADYIVGNSNSLLQVWDRRYGVAFELLLLSFERILGLQDSRSIYFSRHLLTHLFFLAGGFICYFLAKQLFNNRLLALFTMLLFLLHPRMYAHSFINSKDIPFLSMFMITLFLIWRGFRKDTVGAFLLCGTGIGLLTNIRIMGVMLFAAVLAMRVCDYIFASAREEKQHVLITSGVFVFVAVFTLYVTWPWLWSDPVGHFIEALTRMSAYPHQITALFQGKPVSAMDLPFNYVPTWILITTPPVALLLGVVGMITVFASVFTRPGDILRNTPQRFGFLLIACFWLPILAVVMMRSTLYDGWRQMYFLYAPFCVLAAFGLHGLCDISKRIRLGEWVVNGLVGTGIGTTVVSMILLHPLQHLYFNSLVDRSTAEVEYQFWMGHPLNDWGSGALIPLKYLAEQYPSSSIYITSGNGSMNFSLWSNARILPTEDRERIIFGFSLDRTTDQRFLIEKEVAVYQSAELTFMKYNIQNNLVFDLVSIKISARAGR